jgi:hypothetical protein
MIWLILGIIAFILLALIAPVYQMMTTYRDRRDDYDDQNRMD